MLYNVGFATLSHAPALPKVKDERKSNRQKQERVLGDRSDLTVGAEKSVASSTMFAILQMAEGAAGDAAPLGGASAASAFDLHGPDGSQVWWINHPLMQRDYSLDFKIEDCYAEMMRIIDSPPDSLAQTRDFEPLKTAIADHSIRFPVTSGSRELFNIIEIFFDEHAMPAHSAFGA